MRTTTGDKYLLLGMILGPTSSLEMLVFINNVLTLSIKGDIDAKQYMTYLNL